MLLDVFVIGALVVSAAGVGAVIHYFDYFQKEAKLSLLIAALLGAAAMMGSVVPQTWLVVQLTPQIGFRLASVVVPGVVEELIKFLLVASLALCGRRFIDDPLDGLVYGALIGLGMGLEEAVDCYLYSGSQAAAYGQACGGFLGHPLFGAVIGFSFGLHWTDDARFRRAWRVWLAANTLLAVVVHTLWDWLATQQPATLGTSACAALLIFFGMMYFVYLASLGHELSRLRFDPQAAPIEALTTLRVAVRDFFHALRWERKADQPPRESG